MKKLEGQCCKKGHLQIADNVYIRPNGKSECYICKRSYSKSYYNLNKEKESARGRLYYNRNKERISHRQKKWFRKLKIDVLTAYGSYCLCCGEQEPVFLTIEHPNKDGSKERKEIGLGTTFYCYLRRENYPSGYEVLCYNCNRATYLGICPHNV